MPSTATRVLDGLSTSVAVKAPCKVAAIANISLSGEQTVSGTACVEGDRVLVTDQTNPIDNGIYLVSTGQWQRSPDFDGNRDVVKGTVVLIADALNLAYIVSSDTPVIGEDAINFTPASLVMTQGAIGAALFPTTAAETLAAIAPNPFYYQPLDPRRYGNNWTSWAAVQAAASSASEQADNYRWNRVEPTSFGLGKNALIATVAGAIENFAIGEDALKSQTTGIANLAIGFSSCPLFTTGSFNTAVGINTMLFYTNGLGFNTVLGYGSYARGLDGSNNVAMGFETIHDNKSGNQNVALGSAALKSGLNGVSPAPADPSNCVAVGNEALRFCYQSANTAIGFGAMRGNAAFSSAQESVAVGSQSLNVVTSGSSNTMVGYQTGMALTTSSENTVVGNQAGKTLTTGGQNVAIGRFSLFYNATCTQNTFLGTYAGFGLVGNAGGGQNVGIGFQSMDTHNSSATNCVAVGMNTLRAVTGGNNTAVGHSAGVAVTSGTHNTLAGYQSGLVLTTGSSNTCFGQQSGKAITTGDENICIGPSAGIGVSTASFGVYIGSGTATNLNGANNTAVGFNAGSQGSAQTYSNTSSFGNGATPTAANQVTLGNASVATLRCQVTTITALSDLRDKMNLRPATLGLDFINAVHIREFDWNRRDGSCTGKREIGVIAQELQTLSKDFGAEWLELVCDADPERLEATPGKLLFPLIRAVQEQSEQIASLKEQLSALAHQ